MNNNSVQEDQRATKKVKNRVLTIEDDETTQQTENMHTDNEAQVESAARKDHPKSPEKLSYAAMAARGSILNKNPPVKMLEEEIVFQEGDVIMDTLKTESDTWCDDQEILKGHVKKFYEELFTKDPLVKQSLENYRSFPSLNREQWNWMDKPFENIEIKDALFNMNPLKAPGVDGQTSFIPGRIITDNIILAQEVIHSMKKKKCKKWYLAIKIDLEKAYDILDWNFIRDNIEKLGLPNIIIMVIMNCITSTTIQINWNEELTEPFKQSRGIRQGDLFSPYLFVICMERLAQEIALAVEQVKWKPI
ncbi:uncharacterized protein LOC120125058 [Hibiscus syriacus]|uniref:uncharacterized protein LOC120125058 n=1 Tax=Hibiscus syriacus TaxID=106335 RepID=UPI001925004F|nr:uncharacterized protein LOC120125058 [Hibiscus syriacus]